MIDLTQEEVLPPEVSLDSRHSVEATFLLKAKRLASSGKRRKGLSGARITIDLAVEPVNPDFVSIPPASDPLTFKSPLLTRITPTESSSPISNEVIASKTGNRELDLKSVISSRQRADSHVESTACGDSGGSSDQDTNMEDGSGKTSPYVQSRHKAAAEVSENAGKGSIQEPLCTSRKSSLDEQKGAGLLHRTPAKMRLDLNLPPHAVGAAVDCSNSESSLNNDTPEAAPQTVSTSHKRTPPVPDLTPAHLFRQTPAVEGSPPLAPQSINRYEQLNQPAVAVNPTPTSKHPIPNHKKPSNTPLRTVADATEPLGHHRHSSGLHAQLKGETAAHQSRSSQPVAPPADDLSWIQEPDFSELDAMIHAHEASKMTSRQQEQQQSAEKERTDVGGSGRGEAADWDAGRGLRLGEPRGVETRSGERGVPQTGGQTDHAWDESANGRVRGLSQQQEARGTTPMRNQTDSRPQGRGWAGSEPLTDHFGREQREAGPLLDELPLSGLATGTGISRGLQRGVGQPLRKKPRVVESGSDSEEEREVKPSGCDMNEPSTLRKTPATGVVIDRKVPLSAPKRTPKPCLLDSDSDCDVSNDVSDDVSNHGKRKADSARAGSDGPVASLKERVLRTVGRGSAKKPVKAEGGSGKGGKTDYGEDKVEEALERLRRKVADEGQFLHVESQPARPALFKIPQWPLQKKIAEALHARGAPQLYSHQAEAISHVFGGSSLVVATPTASGKSLTYAIPVLDAILSIPKARALLVFPTKALARDQLKAMRELIDVVKPGIVCEQFDGDTPFEDRKQIMRKAQIIFTNPDIIHRTILHNHKYWKTFLSNLAFCVIDEAHHYKGAFGSHVGLVLRRLVRVAQHHKGTPQFICCSATINNPVEHVSRLISKHDTQLVKGSGAPLGPRHIVLWQPGLIKDGDGKRKSAYVEAAKVMVEMVRAGLQTLVFVGARKLTEIVCNAARDMLKDQKRLDLMEKVESYRAGYTPEERRRLEKSLASGELRALVSTNALELGIDIGQLDCTIHVGLPDTMSSLWQQIGRAGRRHTSSLAVIIGQERPLDQHYMRHPDQLFARGIEDALCDPLNPYLLRMHLPCAANELPLTEEDEAFFGSEFGRLRDELVEASELKYIPGPDGTDQYAYRWEDNPAAKFNIRGAAQDPYKVEDENGRFIEEVEKSTAFRRIHKGAIFLHQRDSYEVLALHVEEKKAIVRSCSPNYMTEVKDITRIVILEPQESRTALAANLVFGTVKVIETIVAFQKKHIVHDKLIEEQGLQLPPTEFDTCSIWWDVPPEVVHRLEDALMDAMLGVKRMVVSILPQMSMMDRHDIGGLAVHTHEATQKPQVFVFDAYPGGIGITKRAFGVIEDVWRQALTVLQECGCSKGCPSCVQPSSFENDEGSMAIKKATRILLEALLADWMRTPDTTEEVTGAETGPSGIGAGQSGATNAKVKAAPLKDATNVAKKELLERQTVVEGKGKSAISKAKHWQIIDLEDE